MHPVLRLDDLLRHIFASSPPECLPVAARTCRAWTEPALDQVWSHLCSLVPLLQLIPGVACVNGEYTALSEDPLDLRVFYSYARRVRNITQRHTIRVQPTLLAKISPESLSGLVATRLSSLDPLSLPAALSFSSNLRHLDVDFGFKGPVSISESQLDNLRRVSAALERVRLRGTMEPRLNAFLSDMCQLKSLTLRTGTFVTAETLYALSAFPNLVELDLDAPGVDLDAFPASWPTHEPFSQLQHLRLSASADILRLFMTVARSASLRSLHLDARTCPDWRNIVAAIGIGSSETLQSLTIEHHIDDIPIEGDSQDTKSDINLDRITLDTLRLMTRFGRLEKLVLDTTYPVDLSDADIGELAALRSWPCLEHLDLGSVFSFECLPSSCLPRMTLTTLDVLASALPALRTLALPLNLQHLSEGKTASVSLTRLVVSCPATPSSAVDTGRQLSKLFPSLTEVEGMTGEQEEFWKTVQLTL
ncbi:hypothetical protein MKEN_01088700 [Mycena kentingensis (nom. inval.)]|nr:hypothetical protein MKEN_01088700 [Mycena kentingensis (nom. inval.)]